MNNEILNNLRHKDEKFKEYINSLDLLEVVSFVESLELEDLIHLSNNLSPSELSEFFPYFDNEVKKKLIINLDEKYLKSLFDYVQSDDILDFVDNFDEKIKEKLFQVVSTKRKIQIRSQMAYEENTAGAIMSSDFIELSMEDDTFSALKKIKKQANNVESISTCFITDENHLLVGSISMKDVLLAPENIPLKDLMYKDVVNVNDDDDREKVANVMSKYDLLLVPVVDEYHHILGIITIDDIIDVIEAEITEDIHKMSGLQTSEGSYLDSSIISITKSRIFWLLILMISSTISGMIIDSNQNIALKLPSLLIFMPMLMSTAGNAGSQSSSMVIRGIIVDNLTFKNFFTILKKEILNSLFLGLILCVVNTIRIIFFMSSIGLEVALLVSFTIYLVVIIANIIGGSLPLIAQYFKLDPTSMSGPVLSTLCDAISLTIYFALASLMIGGVL